MDFRDEMQVLQRVKVQQDCSLTIQLQRVDLPCSDHTKGEGQHGRDGHTNVTMAIISEASAKLDTVAAHTFCLPIS